MSRGDNRKNIVSAADSGVSRYPIVCRIVNSRHSKGPFHKSRV